jgi:hypothetical protein
MIVKQNTIAVVPLYVPFAELGEKFDKLDNDREFTRTAERVNRTFSISRSDYREAPAPMATDLISDDAMERIADYLRDVFQTYNPRNIETDDEFDEAFWKEQEDFLVDIGIPYYEDDTTDLYKVGERVFHIGMRGNCYGTIVKVNEYTVTVKADDGSEFESELYELFKEY